ncbi:transcription elongation factor (TFIIS) family protein [Wolffia australiana]
MNTEEFEKLLERSGLDLWTVIETAIFIAARDHGKELRSRRDGFVEKLYATRSVVALPVELENNHGIQSSVVDREMNSQERRQSSSPLSPQLRHQNEEEEDEDDHDHDDDDQRQTSHHLSVEDEQSKILAIKEHLHDPEQSEESLVHMLQTLADMDLTFKALQGTDIGRHVNGLRKHASAEVRRLVKLLVRKWKDLVDDWVKSNSSEPTSSAVIPDGDSPKRKASHSQNGNHVPDLGYSPNAKSGSISDKASSEGETRSKAHLPLRNEAPTKAKPPTPLPLPPSHRAKEKEKDSLLDPERLASAKRRLHENYQEAENAKKQRTIQVVDINDVPKPRGSLSARHKGAGFQAKHW